MDNNRLNVVYDKTHGFCHICHKKLSFKNYGVHSAKGSWNIEHSTPKSKGGTDHLNNLFPACISCNLKKGTRNTRTVRSQNGLTRAPYSKAKKEQIKNDNMVALGAIGFAVGAAVGGPIGGFLLACFGSQIGKEMSPKR